ncbi:MAG: dihydrolipoamide acetyltransferase component of pyruvate dehydrogenase complex [Gemmatales bacterium]|nr:MAG: dihydrolipoamide acetyltransferase component of pyruvate dehydrogenase complex [Gemmatales bacterium]
MDFPLPELGEGVYEAELVSWLVKVGDKVKRGQNLMEVLTDKATMEVPAPFAGTITELKAQPGDQIKVGQVVLCYAADEMKPLSPGRVETSPRSLKPLAAAPSSPSATSATPSVTPSFIKAAPSVRLMARKLGIDLTQVRGTGPGGRILIGDLTAYVKNSSRSLADGNGKSADSLPKLDFGTPGTRIKLQGVRKKIAEHMVLSKKTIPHYSYMDECDVTELVHLRESLRGPFAKAGVKLTYLAFFVKAVAHALKEIPIVNASLDEQAGEIVLHDHYHVGIAVATANGLYVPVIRDAAGKTLAQIARDIDRLSSEARANRCKREDLTGSTFTITSIGNIGGLISTPVINHPEVGIMGIGKVVKRPVYDAGGQLKPADIVYLSFSFDHRVVDGAVGAAFGNAVLRRLRNPAALVADELLR